MARLLYGYQPADFVVAEDAANSDALILAGATLDVYDEPGGTQETDLLDSSETPASDVTVAAGGTIIFYGADGYEGDYYLTPDSGTTWYRFSPSTATLFTRLGAVEAGRDLNDLDDVNTSGATDGQALVYNSGTSTWAPGTVGSGGANVLEGVIITDGSSSAAYPDDDFLVFRPVA